MYTKIDLSSTEYQNLRRDILRRVGFNRSLNLASKKTDDEVYAKAYRNASGRIDTFFEKMNDANYKLQWFEIDKLTEDQLIRLACFFVFRRGKYKNLYDDLKNENTSVNYRNAFAVIFELSYSKIFNDDTSIMTLESFDLIGKRLDQKCDFVPTFNKLYEVLKNTNGNNYRDSLIQLKELNHMLRFCILDEKQELLNSSKTEHCFRYIDLYIQLIDDLVKGSILYMVGCFAETQCEGNSLADAYNHRMDLLVVRSHRLLYAVEKAVESVQQKENRIEDINLCIARFFCWMYKKVEYREYRKIRESLMDEVKQYPEKFGLLRMETNGNSNVWLKKSYKYVDDYKKDVKKLIKEKTRVDGYDSKSNIVNLVMQYVDKSREEDIRYDLYNLDIRSWIILFKEFFIMKEKCADIPIQPDKLIRHIVNRNFDCIDNLTIKSNSIYYDEFQKFISDDSASNSGESAHDESETNCNVPRVFWVYTLNDEYEVTVSTGKYDNGEEIRFLYILDPDTLELKNNTDISELPKGIQNLWNDCLKKARNAIYDYEKYIPVFDLVESKYYKQRYYQRFFEEKYIRGYLDSMGYIDSYEKCCELMRIMGEVILQVYSLMNDICVIDVLTQIFDYFVDSMKYEE